MNYRVFTQNKRGSKILIFVLVFALLFSVFEFNNSIEAKPLDANSVGRDVAIFVSGALIGGAIYDGAKWVLTSGALASLTPAGAAAVLALLGGALLISAIYMDKGGDKIQDYKVAECLPGPGDFTRCPTSFKLVG